MATSVKSALRVSVKIVDLLHARDIEHRRPWNDRQYEIHDNIDIVELIKRSRLRCVHG